jgi:hypothetical protein
MAGALMSPESAMARLRDPLATISQAEADKIAACMARLCAEVSTLRQRGLGDATEFLTWISTSVRLPDSDLTVHIAIEGNDNGPTWLGYLDGDEWRSVDGALVEGTVVAWAEMLMGPANMAREEVRRAA